MTFSTSGIFGQTIMDILNQTTAIDFNSDTWYLALFNNTPTPDYSATAANVALGAGQWASGEVYDGVNWLTGGQALTTVAFTIDTPATGQFNFSSDNVSQASTNLSSIYGCFVYNYTVATPVDNQGLFAVAFSGAPYSTTNGTITITVNSNGWFYSDYTP